MSPPVRVLHVITGLGSGGAEMMLCKLLSRLDASRIKSIVISLGDMGVVGDVIRSAGIPVYTLNIKNFFGVFSGLAKLIKMLNSQRPDIVQTWLYHADLLGLLAGRLAGIPVIGWNVRCSDLNEGDIPLSTRLVRGLLAKLSANPEFVLVNSEAGRLSHEKLGYRARRWVLIPNGFDVEKFRPNPDVRGKIRHELGVTGEMSLIGLVARYHPMKGHEVFLRAAHDIAKVRDQVRFVMIGSGVDSNNKALTSMIHDLGLRDKVSLMGYRENMANILPALDIMSSTSWGEGFPNVLGEAMSCAVPCVVTDVGDSARIVGDAGLVVPAGDWEALVRAWEGLLDLPDGKKAELGRQARERIESLFSLEQVTEQYERVYEEYARQ